MTDIAIELARCLEASTVALIAERDCLYESVTNGDGEYLDPDDERQVAEYDEIIDANQRALARVEKEEEALR